MATDSDFAIRMLIHALNEAEYGHMEHRNCTAAAPMPLADKDKYRWRHADAVEGAPFFNLVHCRCPHCGFEFTCMPRQT